MGRKKLLTDEQWEEIKRRSVAGESHTALAREFGVSRPLVVAKVSTKRQELRNIAIAKLEIDKKIENLPINDRTAVVNYIDRLKSLGNNLMIAANYGAANSARLHKIAHSRVQALNAANIHTEDLRDIAAITQVANQAASIGSNLYAAAMTQDQASSDREHPLTREGLEAFHDCP